MEYSNDPMDPTILGEGFKDVVILDSKALFVIREDSQSALYEEMNPKFEVTVNAPFEVGERVRDVLEENQFVISALPDNINPRDFWLRWKAMVKFPAAGDNETEDGRKKRLHSIRFFWRRLVAELTEAVLGDELPRSNTRPVTNLNGLTN